MGLKYNDVGFEVWGLGLFVSKFNERKQNLLCSIIF